MTAPIESLRDALAVVNGARRSLPEDAEAYSAGLACGFTPLHLQTFLQAQLQSRRPAARVAVDTGLYGALPEGLEQLAATGVRSCAVVIEWSDLDPRLGKRESVAAPIATDDDVVSTVTGRLARLRDRIEPLAANSPTALVLPGLDLAPAYASPPGLVSPLETRLRSALADFAADVSSLEGVRLVAPAFDGPVYDLQSDIRSGFPYTAGYASALAAALGAALAPVPPKKGLITDLDDTLWRGLVGEVGADAVTWDLDSGALVHSLYQQQLQSLADRGILLGATSKNDPEPVEQALDRPDLLLDRTQMFPVIASWTAKSEGVARILEAWNIAASDVVFVDDNPMELAEVQAAFPGIEIVPFPTHDPDGVDAMLATLRGFFGRRRVSAEDRLRLASIRSGAELRAESAQAGDDTDFLRDLSGHVVVDDDSGWRAPRALELVNKTNQFNINGRRLDESEWRSIGESSDALACTVSYTDRFGALGVIAVLAGRVDGRALNVETWVMSCRAFSRAIEHHVLAALLDRHGLDEARVRFAATDRNDVVARFLDTVGRTDTEGIVIVERRTLERSDRIGIHATDFASS
jgi:FkbH-like protein